VGAATTGAPLSPIAPGNEPDPTDVLGRRYAAFVLDGLLTALLTAVAILAVGGLTRRDGVLAPGQLGGAIDLGWNDRTYSVEGAGEVVLYLVPLAYVLVCAVLAQGLTGATPGKAAFGIRVVDSRGGGPGIGRALVRTLLLPVDMIGCGLPLVGPITSSASRGHRRVGDMVGQTFVVDRAATGRPIVVTPSPAAVGAAAVPPAGVAAPSAVEPHPQAPPPQPRWDAARGAWVLWDPNRSRWLVHDPAVGLWREL
jgi:uncharacterized RDD family membrane protein YckC